MMNTARLFRLFLSCSILTLIPFQFASAQTMTKREIRYQYKKANKAFKAGKYEKASRFYFDIIENGAASPGYQRASRNKLASALFRQKLHLVSLRYVIQLMETTTKKNMDRAFLRSLLGMLKIAETLGDETLVIQLLRQVKPFLQKIPKSENPIKYLLPVPERYQKREKIRNNWLKTRKRLSNPLSYMLGRMHFLRRSPGFATAHRFFDLITKDAPNNYYAKGRYLKGVMFAWKGKNKKAIGMFRAILKLKPKDDKVASNLRQIKVFAQYGISRAYYALGMRERSAKKSRETLITSLKEYFKLPKRRKLYQAQMLFETAYVHFMMEQYHFALGKLIALQSPYYETGFFPELQILRALIYYKNCKYEDTKETVNNFEKRYNPLKKMLLELTGRKKKRKWLAQYYEFFLKEEKLMKEKKKTQLPTSLIVLIGSEKSLRNYRTLLGKLEKELKTIRSKGARWKESNLGRALLEVALNFRTTLKKFAGNSTWGSLSRVFREVSELLSQAGLIKLQTLQDQKKELMRYAEGGGIEQDEYRYTIVTEQSHIYWPYQGEYWRDEVGHYRQFIQGECKR